MKEFQEMQESYRTFCKSWENLRQSSLIGMIRCYCQEILNDDSKTGQEVAKSILKMIKESEGE